MVRDQTKVDLPAVNKLVKHGGVSIRETWESFRDLKLEQWSTFQQDNDPKYTWTSSVVTVHPMCVILGVQEKMGVMNRGVVYSLWDYEPQRDDELGFTEGNCMTVLRREDDVEMEWWWARCADQEGYIPRNLLGVS